MVEMEHLNLYNIHINSNQFDDLARQFRAFSHKYVNLYKLTLRTINCFLFLQKH